MRRLAPTVLACALGAALCWTAPAAAQGEPDPVPAPPEPLKPSPVTSTPYQSGFDDEFGGELLPPPRDVNIDPGEYAINHSPIPGEPGEVLEPRDPKDGDAPDPADAEAPNGEGEASAPQRRPAAPRSLWLTGTEEDLQGNVIPPPERRPSAAQDHPPAHATQEISSTLAKAIEKEERETEKLKGAKWEKRVEAFRKLAPLYEAVVQAEPENAEAVYRWGLVLAKSGNERDGAAQLQRAVELMPDVPKYLIDYSLMALRQGKISPATAAALRATQLDPTNPRAYNALGTMLLSSGNFAAARQNFLAAHELDKSTGQYLHNAARSFLTEKKYDDAERWLTQVIQYYRKRLDEPGVKKDKHQRELLEHRLATVYNDRGYAYEHMNQAKTAISDYKSALELYPKYAQAHYNLALLYTVEDDPAMTNYFESLEHAKKACELTEFKNPRYLMAAAEAARVNRHYDKAAGFARTAIDMMPANHPDLPGYRKLLDRYMQLMEKGFIGNVPEYAKPKGTVPDEMNTGQ